MEPKQTKSAGGVVINNDGKILIVSQFGTSWSLPKGHIELGEDAVMAARREIFEESGISDLVLLKELGTYQRFRVGVDGEEDKSELKTITIFLFKTNQEKLHPGDVENPEARWVEKDKVFDSLTIKGDKEFFQKIKDQILCPPTSNKI